jgi:hypothetical protein
MTQEIIDLKRAKGRQSLKEAFKLRGPHCPYAGVDRQIWELSRLEGDSVFDIALKLNVPEKYVLGMTQLMDERGH